MSAHDHKHSTLKRMAMRGATVAIGGLAVLGAGAGVAGASTTLPANGGSDWGDTPNPDWHGSNSSLVDLSHNQVPIQACHNQVPVNVLGGQVPVQDVTGSLGLGILGSAGHGAAGTDGSCTQPSGQDN